MDRLYFIILHISQDEQLLIFEGTRQLEVYTVLCNTYDIFVIWCFCSRDVQIMRLMDRDNKTYADAIAYCSHKNELIVADIGTFVHFSYNSEEEMFSQITSFLAAL